MIAQQTHTGIPPNIRRLLSHWFLFPRRIAIDSVGAIARSCMLEKQTLKKCLDFCEGDYDFLLVENIPVEHRSRALRTYLPTCLPVPGICSYQRGHAKGAAATACRDFFGME